MRAVYTFLTLFLLSQAPAALAACAIEPDGNGHVTIPDGQTSIANMAFEECTALTSVTIPNTVTSIGEFAFAFTALTSITIPDSVESIGPEAFNGCTAIQTITIPDTVTSMSGYGIFRDCTSLTSVTIGSGVTSLGQSIFRGCTALTSITIPDTVTSFGLNPFHYVDSITQVCGVDATQAPFSDHSQLQVQTTQAQCTEPACPAGVSGVKWCVPLCTSPDTTLYDVTETNLAPDSFDVSATCATGAVGTATVSACSASGQPYVLSGCRVTYDCASPATTGEFVLADDCTLNGEVSLTGDLDILGVVKGDGSYPVITAATSSRHFGITSGAHKLTLKYLKMVDGDVSGISAYYYGGSIYVKSVAATLNISDSEFFNNRAGFGGAIYAWEGDATVFLSDVSFDENHANWFGGAVSLNKATLVDHSSTYNMNTAGEHGGALHIFHSVHISVFDSSFTSNTAGYQGGGIYIEGSGNSLSSLDMSSVTLQSNKQTGAGTYAEYGGGGLYLRKEVTANIRECTFIENEATEGSTGDKHGHQIFTSSYNSYIPSITIVNTNFTHIAGDNAFYGFEWAGSSTHGADKYVSPTTCSAEEPCSASPYTGDCADLGNEGTTCDINCPSGSWAPDGALSCSPHTTCGNQVGGTTRLTGESATAAGTCAACSAGTDNGSGDCVCAADEKSDAGLCKKLIDCLTATEQGHRNIDIGVDSGDYTVSFS